MFRHVAAKLGTMRKAQNFTVVTMTNNHIMVQSDKAIGQFDPATGKGRLSIKGNSFLALSTHSKPYEFPADFRQACADAIATQGKKIDLGGVVVSTEVKID